MEPTHYRNIAPRPAFSDAVRLQPHIAISQPHIIAQSQSQSTYYRNIASRLAFSDADHLQPQIAISQPRRIVQSRSRQSGEVILSQARQILLDDFKTSESAAATFPPLLTDDINYESVKKFQVKIDETIASMKIVCASCGLFIKPETENALDKKCDIFKAAINSQMISESGLDTCGINQAGLVIFCNICFVAIAASKPPKFGLVNAVNTTCCHEFPAELNDLTLVEEALIARAHPVSSILKLRPAGRASPQSVYEGIRGHAVVLPQNPGPLINMLPSSTFQVHDVIRVVWASDKAHTKDQLRPFLTVRNDKVQAALEWLRRNNPMYQRIIINHEELNGWANEFIPTGIVDHIVQCAADHTEKEGYAADLETDNHV